MSSIVIGTAGHIDHGKSALVRALTGIDPDRLKEEQARGITIDLGFAHAAVGETTIAFVDVPGHERFVRNMLAGAGGIDAVVLVVAANEAVKPQTREHFEICRLLGIDRGLIALTKADLVDAETLALAALDVRELVAGSFLERSPIVAVSAVTGAGLDEVKSAIAGLAGGIPRQARDGVARLAVDRAFTRKGFGTVVTGTLVSGTVAIGDELALLPGEARVRVRGLHAHGAAIARAGAPQRLAINLGAIEVADVPRGVTLASPGTLPMTRRVDARVFLLPAARPLAHGARVRVHHGAAEHLARVSVAAIRTRPEADWNSVEPGDSGVTIPAGAEAFVRLRFDTPVVVTRGDRLILRAPSPPATIGGAAVLDPEPPRSGVRRAASFARFVEIDDERWSQRWLTEAGEKGLSDADLVRRGGLSPAQAQAQLDALVDRGAGARDAGQIVSAPVAAARDRARAEQARRAAPAPALQGVEAQAATVILERLAAAGLAPPDLATLSAELRLPPDVVARVVAALVRERRLARVDALVFHADSLDRLKQDVIASGRAAAPAKAFVDVPTFKTRFGLTRKFAIPLLEWLDRERVTRRIGEKREVIVR